MIYQVTQGTYLAALDLHGQLRILNQDELLAADLQAGLFASFSSAANCSNARKEYPNAELHCTDISKA